MLLHGVLLVGYSGVTVDLMLVDGGTPVQSAAKTRSRIKSWMECVRHFATEIVIASRTANKTIREPIIWADFPFFGMLGSAELFDAMFVALASAHCGKPEPTVPQISPQPPD